METADAEIRKFYHNIPGCGGKIEKISEEAYKTVIICTIPNMKSEDIDKHLPIKSKELLEYTKEEIIDYHHNDLKCE